MRITLLGPQRRPRVDAVVRSLELSGPFATVTAGWRERETEDGELDALLSGKSVNLQLYRRFGEVLAADPEYAAAVARRREILVEMSRVHVLRLDLAVQSVTEIRRADVSTPVREAALQDAVQAIRALDAAHIAAVDELDAQFYQDFPPHEREPIATHRAEIGRLVGECGALAMAGGHVGELAEVLHLFNVAALLRQAPGEFAVLAWSAGAMAITDRVVLFHDRRDHGPSVAEAYLRGLGLVPGVVALPSAHRRLRMDDLPAMALLAERFAPARCLVLEAGDRIDLGDGGCLPSGAPVIGPVGRVEALDDEPTLQGAS